MFKLRLIHSYSYSNSNFLSTCSSPFPFTIFTSSSSDQMSCFDKNKAFKKELFFLVFFLYSYSYSYSYIFILIIFISKPNILSIIKFIFIPDSSSRITIISLLFSFLFHFHSQIYCLSLIFFIFSRWEIPQRDDGKHHCCLIRRNNLCLWNYILSCMWCALMWSSDVIWCHLITDTVLFCSILRVLHVIKTSLNIETDFSFWWIFSWFVWSEKHSLLDLISPF